MQEIISGPTRDASNFSKKLFVISRPNVVEVSALGRFARLLSRPYWGNQAWTAKLFGGHFSVLKSVLMGLRSCRKSFRFNTRVVTIPPNSDVLLLSGHRSLEELLKLSGVRITVGPNFSNKMEGVLGLLENTKVRNVLVPSQWVADLYRELYPAIGDKVQVWASGAEVPRFAKFVSSRIRRSRILIYAKGDAGAVEGVRSLLKHKMRPFSLLTYGSHSRLRFLFELARCGQLIYVARTESQGIALQEAWAMSVRTLVYRDVDYLKAVYGSNESFMETTEFNSFAPYLSSENGTLWKDLGELSSALDSYCSGGNPKLRAGLNGNAKYPKSHKEAVERLLKIIDF